MPRTHKTNNEKQPVKHDVEIKIISGSIYKFVADDQASARAFGTNAVRIGFWARSDDGVEILVPPRYIEYVKIYPTPEDNTDEKLD